MPASPNGSALPATYDRVARGLHWSMALIIVAALVLGLTIDDFPRAWKYVAIESHKGLGIALLVLLAARVAWRLGHRPPPSAESSALLRAAAGLGHAGLYLLMLAVPALGFAYAALRGQGFDFGLFAIPPLSVAADRAVTRPIREVHELAAYALIGLAALHALAALWHQFVRKDDVMRRMLPSA